MLAWDDVIPISLSEYERRGLHVELPENEDNLIL